MRLAGAVILYHPDNQVISNILSYLHGLDILYVLDNTESPDIHIREALKRYSKVRYVAFGANKGISYALNYAISRCTGYEYLLTMDQDSSFCPGDIEKYKYKIESMDRSDVAVYGVRYDKDWNRIRPDRYVKQLITSGSIIDINISRGLNGFDENLFIDCVDFEYCYNAAEHGYKILEFGDIIFNHQLGETKIRKLFWKHYERHEHNAIRRYYITRNNIYLLKRYKGKRNFARFREAMRAFWGILLWEENKIPKMNAWVHGFKDGILGNMGKCNRIF